MPCQPDYNPADHYIWETSVDSANLVESRKKVDTLTESFMQSDFHAHNLDLIEQTITNSTDGDIFKDLVKIFELNFGVYRM